MPKPSEKRPLMEDSLEAVKDKRLRDIIRDIWDYSVSVDIAKQTPKKYAEMVNFCHKMNDVRVEDVEWNDLCDLVDENTAFGFQCMRLLHAMLNRDLYCGRYKNELLKIKNCFNIRKQGLMFQWYRRYFVHDEIKYVYYSSEATNRRIFFIRTDNPYLFSLFCDFCSFDKYADKNKEDIEGRDWFWYHIAEIMGPYEKKVSSPEDFNYLVFQQMEKSCKESPKPEAALRKLYRFFAYLIEKTVDSGIDIFKEADPIDYSALKRDDFAKRIANGYQYIYYNPYAQIPETDKWILQINGFDRGTTKLKATASKIYDFTRIRSKFYRQLAKFYFWNESRSNFNTKYEHFICIIDVFNKLSDIKKKNNDSEAYITINDTSFMRLWINSLKLSVATRTSKVVVLRQFLSDMQAEGKIDIEYFALEYLKQFGNARNKDAHAIPEKDLECLNAIMMKKAGESIQNSYCYAILHILLQTEFRLSQVCHLETGCVLPTVNKNQFLLTKSKTSNGQEYEAVITDFTKSLIDDSERLSKDTRDACTSEKNIKYLFLYKSKENQYIPIEGRYFREYMIKCCDEAGIPHYTPANIRDFHMTKAEEENLRKGYSDMRLRTLSGHAHVDTTRNHYIETKLTQIIEAMYGIIIGNIDLNGNVVDAIPEAINDKKHSVEAGCGHCGLNSCIDDRMISCLLCKDFYTTVDNLGDFRKMINYLDSLIKDKKWEHDKEDLVNKKRLAGAYILAIELKLAETKGISE